MQNRVYSSLRMYFFVDSSHIRPVDVLIQIEFVVKYRLLRPDSPSHITAAFLCSGSILHPLNETIDLFSTISFVNDAVMLYSVAQ